MADESEVIPKDNPTDAKYRVYASISFAVLLLGVGVPLWWHTTAVLRADLPYAGIASLSKLDTKIYCKIYLAAISDNRAKLLTDEITKFFHNSELYKVNVSHEVISSSLVSSSFTPSDYEKVASSFDLKVGELLLLEAPNLSSVVVGTSRSVFYPSDTSGIKLAQILSQWILRDKSLALTRNALADPTKYSLDEDNRRRFPASPAYDILLTMINPDPEKLKINLNLAQLSENYIEPFLQHLSIVANYSVKSQWLYLMPLDVKPKLVKDSTRLGKHYALSEDVLPQLITPLEKKLGSQMSLHPCINLVAYAVPCENSPIYIYTKAGHKSKFLNNVEAFLSPRWGGVIISNPPADVCEEAKSDEPVEVVPSDVTIMGVFLAQLRVLIGIPDPEDIIPGAQVTPLVGSKPRDWELDALLRIRAIEQLTSAKLTLQSLAQLLGEISNIVITETVGNRIKNALNLVELSANKLENGYLTEGFLLSKEAFITAEAAFTDPSLLALLYFPDDQKYAVYIPLFLPVMIPVLLSLKNIKRYYFPSSSK
ncbi:GPI transamidase component PIG-S [Aphidius gifuensis]|uniref:GPI transamidase component PIG-S n=1 Tax=Aphidius gifuensis TaxID=684658 RepID=UPI001CDC2202|nr:GPI transamidase component PIG-S [Aphidius gifuensis]